LIQNFRSLWASISESKPGDVIGPVYIPAYSGVAVDGVPQTLPPAYMIVKIIDHRPEGTKPLEDAKQELASSILVRKMLAELREEYGVEIYRDKIANPDLFQSRPMA